MEIMQISEILFGPVSDIAWRAAIVLGLVSLFLVMLQGASAAVRHLVWSMSFIGVLVLPAIWAFTPLQITLPVSDTKTAPTEFLALNDSIEVPIDVAEVTLATNTSGAPELSYTSTTLADIRAGLGNEPAVIATRLPADGPRVEIPWKPLFVGVWLCGVLVCAAPLLLGGWSLSRLRRKALPLSALMAGELHELAGLLLGGRTVVGVQSASRQMPMTWGVWRPVVLLPAAAADWSPERRRLVLLHELAHIRRHDCLLQMIGQLVRALHWFNPLAWWALSELRLEQEKACDDAVLNLGTHADEYAAELLAVSARLPRLSWDLAVALAMSRVTRLEQRLKAILNMKNDRRPVSKWSAAWCLTVLTSLVFATAIIDRQPAQAAPPAIQVGISTEAAEALKQKEAASPKAEAAATPKAATAEPAATEKPSAGAVPPAAASKDANGNGLSGVLETIESHALQPVDQKALNEAAIRGMIQSLKDPYSTFLTTDELQQFHEQIEGKMVGIGAALKVTDKRIFVAQVIPNSPAIKAGLKAGDEILEVNKQTIGDLQETVKSIRGKSGTEVSIKLLREDKSVVELTLQRAEIRLVAVRGLSTDEQGQQQYWLDTKQKLGYVRVEVIDAMVAEELKSTLKTLSQQGLKGLVLDLRNSPGGRLDSTVDIAQLFLKDSVVVQVRGRKNENDSSLKTGAEAAFYELPLIVLINRRTASAAEVLSAALQDNGRAVVIGERSFGKGTIQSIISVGTDGKGPAVRLTTAQMLTPKGRPWHRHPEAKDWGVDPKDGFYVPLSADQLKESIEGVKNDKAAEKLKAKLPEPVTPEAIEQHFSDPALAAAFKTLQAKLTTGEFAPSGRPLAEQQAHLDKQQELRKQREDTRLKLEQIDRELGNIR